MNTYEESDGIDFLSYAQVEFEDLLESGFLQYDNYLFRDSERLRREHSLHLMSRVCIHCDAHYFEAGSIRGEYLKCCNGGRLVNIPDHKGTPELLLSLIEDGHPKSQNLLRNVRRYNNALALASTSVNEVQFQTTGPPCVVVNGEMRHFLSRLTRT